MSYIDWAQPILLKVPDPPNGKATLQGSFGKDNWQNPMKFTVRLDHVVFRKEGEEKQEVARFDHNGHSVFYWNPPQDGFHIDVFPNGRKQKSWLQTPPPHSDLHDVFDYCRTHLHNQYNAEYLFRVYRGRENFDPRAIGLTPL